MLIAHCSDTHGYWPTIPKDCEVVIHTGDGIPNQTRGNRPIEYQYQTNWVRKNIENYKEWLGGRPLIYQMGNHCFISPVPILVEAGIDATDITFDKHTYKSVRMIGFPYIPYICGEWNFERTPDEMSREIRKLKDQLLVWTESGSEGVDILCTHCPPYGVLDSDIVIRDGKSIINTYGNKWGNIQLTNLLNYGIEELIPNLDQRPKYLLCGHCHEHNSITEEFGMLISNAATTVHKIEIKV